MTKLTDLALLILSDLNVAGDIGRSRNHIQKLVSGNPGVRLGDAVGSLEERGYIVTVTPPSNRLMAAKHFISEHGRNRFLEVTGSL